MERQELISFIWDAYKDVNGIRPRWLDFSTYSDEDLQSWYKSMLIDLREHFETEKVMELEAVKKFEADVTHIISCGAVSRKNAIEWIMEAEDVVDSEALCFAYGLPYNYEFFPGK
jgi:hypothetical protein